MSRKCFKLKKDWTNCRNSKLLCFNRFVGSKECIFDKSCKGIKKLTTMHQISFLSKLAQNTKIWMAAIEMIFWIITAIWMPYMDVDSAILERITTHYLLHLHNPKVTLVICCLENLSTCANCSTQYKFETYKVLVCVCKSFLMTSFNGTRMLI